MSDGDIAGSRATGLPRNVVSDSGGSLDASWPSGDGGKPADAPPDEQPLLSLEAFGPNEAPLAPNMEAITDSLRSSNIFETLYDILSAIALLGNLL